jgi:hypothetical protein
LCFITYSINKSIFYAKVCGTSGFTSKTLFEKQKRKKNVKKRGEIIRNLRIRFYLQDLIPPKKGDALNISFFIKKRQ